MKLNGSPNRDITMTIKIIYTPTFLGFCNTYLLTYYFLGPNMTFRLKVQSGKNHKFAYQDKSSQILAQLIIQNNSLAT